MVLSIEYKQSENKKIHALLEKLILLPGIDVNDYLYIRSFARIAVNCRKERDFNTLFYNHAVHPLESFHS